MQKTQRFVEDPIDSMDFSELVEMAKASVETPPIDESVMPYDCPELREALDGHVYRGVLEGWKKTSGEGIEESSEEDREDLEEAKDDEGEGSYKAKTPLEKMVGEMVRGQSGLWLSKQQMGTIIAQLNKKGITKLDKDSYDDIARVVGKTLASLKKKF